MYRPIEVAVALSLYAYNVSPLDRAEALCRAFNAIEACNASVEVFYDIVRILSTPQVAFAATELGPPRAAEYVRQALERYGEEARERCQANGI